MGRASPKERIQLQPVRGLIDREILPARTEKSRSEWSDCQPRGLRRPHPHAGDDAVVHEPVRAGDQRRIHSEQVRGSCSDLTVVPTRPAADVSIIDW